MKSFIVQTITQLIPVAIGVYLGIIASDWNAQRKQAKLQEDFLVNLYLEIKANKAKMQEVVAYREGILATKQNLYKTLGEATLTGRFWSVGGWKLVPGWSGVRMPTLENSVYQSGIIGNTLSGLEFKTINTIAQVYNAQEEYKSFSKIVILDRLVNIYADATTIDMLRNLDVWEEVVMLEKELITSYDITLLQLKTTLEKDNAH